MSRPKILTWHIHGNYLYYLSHTDCDFYLPIGKGEGYGGRNGGFDWGDNVIEVPAEHVKNLVLDAILFQSRTNYESDQYTILSKAQRRLPTIYLEHDPPREHPTDTKHPVDDPNILLVHVTHFNNLMWDNGRTPTRVIEHGVVVPKQRTPTRQVERGIVVVNNLRLRGRRLGLDIFEQARREVPIDLVGIGSAELGGLGEVPANRIHELTAAYRFLFSPIRYTSLGLATCEAMMNGLPIVGLATTELATVIRNRTHGFIDTDVRVLIDGMQQLLADPHLANTLGQNAARYARQRFGIERFAQDWRRVVRDVTGK